MAKLSQIKLGSTTYDIGAAWGNISGKPSTFPPSSHDHVQLTNTDAAGTLTWSGDHFLSSVNRPTAKLHFGSDQLYFYNGSYYTLIHAGNIGSQSVNYANSAGSVAWGNISGKPSTFPPASHSHRTLENIDSGDVASNSATQRYVFISWNDLTTNRPAYDTRFTFQTSTGQLSAPVFVENGTTLANKYAPKSHTHSYLPLSGGTLTGALTISNGADLNLQAASGSSDSGDLVFKNGSGVEIGRIWLNGSTFSIRYSDTETAKTILTSGNYSDYAATKNHNHDSAYVNVSGDTMSGLLNAHGGISLNSSTPQQTPAYILGIKAFAEGGNIIWQSAGSVSVGYADTAGTCNSLNRSAGSSDRAIWFNGGQPAACNDTLNHNISGYAAKTAFKSSVPMGSYQAGAATVPDLVEEIRYSSGAMGSVSLTTAYAATGGTIAAGWYNFIYSPHRSGGNAGAASGDNHQYGTLILSGMTGNFGLWVIRVTSGSIAEARRVWRAGDSVTGAVWNDYAECRESNSNEPGRVLVENGDDTLNISTERLQQFAGICSDTWGFSQGETDKAKTHIAVAGRVLAYPYQNRNNYKPGDAVCTAPGGTVDIMTEEEIIKYPHRIVGTVSCVPTYETWGGGNDRDPVQVNGRIWIKVK